MPYMLARVRCAACDRAYNTEICATWDKVNMYGAIHGKCGRAGQIILRRQELRDSFAPRDLKNARLILESVRHVNNDRHLSTYVTMIQDMLDAELRYRGRAGKSKR